MISANDFIFGCGVVGSRISYNNFSLLFDKIIDLDINKFDNSYIYGKGLAEKYLNEQVKKKNLKIFSTIKFGRELNFNLSSILVNIFRFEMTNLARIFFETKYNYNLNDIKKFVKRYDNFTNIEFNTFFFHDPKFLLKSFLTKEIIFFLKKKFKQIGCANPDCKELKYICESKFFNVIQLDIIDYLNNKEYLITNFKGEIWVNQIIKFSRKNKIDWFKFCFDQKKKSSNLKFVLGIKNVEIINRLKKELA